MEKNLYYRDLCVQQVLDLAPRQGLVSNSKFDMEAFEEGCLLKVVYPTWKKHAVYKKSEYKRLSTGNRIECLIRLIYIQL